MIDHRSHAHHLSSCQRPVGLITQLVEHWTGIAEVMGSNPFQGRFFSGFNFTTT